jgi:hypothetical protein
MITAINENAFKLSGTKQTIVIIAGLVAVVGPLLLAIGAILSIIPAIGGILCVRRDHSLLPVLLYYTARM